MPKKAAFNGLDANLIAKSLRRILSDIFMDFALEFAHAFLDFAFGFLRFAFSLPLRIARQIAWRFP